VIKLVDSQNNLPWDGEVGLVTGPISRMDIDPGKSVAVLCGPPIMYKFVLVEILKKEIPENHIYVSLERHMKCGIGKCGHCQIAQYYCCKDGPVFSHDQIKVNPEAL
jgi:NAD(P)H-flavin reductase